MVFTCPNLPADKVNLVGLVELRDDLAAKQVSGPPWAEPPTLDVLRVGPEQVTHGTVMRHLLLTIYGADLVQCCNVGREAPMHAEDLVVDDGGQTMFQVTRKAM